MGATCNMCKQKPSQFFPDSNSPNQLYKTSQQNPLHTPIQYNQLQKQIRTHGVLPHLGQFLDSITNDLLKIISRIDQQYGEFIWQPQQPDSFILPPCKYSNGSIYVGAWKNHKRQGNGTLFYKDGRCFQGNWNADEAQGFGRLYHPNGDLHQGVYKNSKPNGPGEYRNKKQNMKFVGKFLDDKLEGEGREEWKDGTVFQGNYRNGLKNGQGKFKWGDGNSYVGNFVENRMEGYGEYRWAAEKEGVVGEGGERGSLRCVRRMYRGDWKDGMMHGKGVFEWEDKRKYTGEYVNDLKEGEGVFEWGDGRVYEGGWKAGVMHGNGKFRDKFGSVVTGVWIKGIFRKSK